MNASPSHPSHHFDDYFNNIHNMLFWGILTLQNLSNAGAVLTSHVALQSVCAKTKDSGSREVGKEVEQEQEVSHLSHT